MHLVPGGEARLPGRRPGGYEAGPAPRDNLNQRRDLVSLDSAAIKQGPCDRGPHLRANVDVRACRWRARVAQKVLVAQPAGAYHRRCRPSV